MRKNWRKQTIATVAKKAKWSRVFENRAIRAIYSKDLGENFVPVPAADDLAPAALRELANKYTMGDLLEAIKDERLDRYSTEQLVKAGATRIDDGRLPRNTVTIDFLKSLSRKKLLELPADILPWIRGYNWHHHIMKSHKGPYREPTVKDLANSDAVLQGFGPTTITRTAILFKQLGFTSKNCSFIRQAMKQSHRIRISERGFRLIELSQVEFD